MPGSRGAASALAAIGDPEVIPRLIEIMRRDPTGAMNYDVGYFALGKLTGVTWHESHDAAWWLSWWETNRTRFTRRG